MRTVVCLLSTLAVTAALAAPAAVAAGGTDQQPALQVTPVGRLPFPERGYVVDLPNGVSLTPRQVHVIENGIGIGDFSFDALSSSGVSYGTILAIDASDSMKGKPEAAALAAAKQFIAQRKPNQEIGVVAFNDKVAILVPPTIDTGQLNRAMAQAPGLSYGTHIYDALGGSLSQLAQRKVSAGSIVLLSDGADVGSATTLKKVVAAAKRQKVRVFTVGLRSGAYDPTTLRAIAKQSGGSYAEASSGKELAAIYSQLGSKLSREYLLQYRSNAAPSSNVDVTVKLDGVGTSTTQYTAPTPSELPPYHRPFFRSFVLSGWSLFLLALVVAGAVALVIRLLLNASRSGFVSRVNAFASTDPEAEAAAKKERDDDWRKRAAKARVSSTAAARGWIGRLDESIDVGRIKVSSMTIIVVTAVCTVLAVILLGLISPIFALFGLGTPLLARAWVRRKVRKVRDDFSDQLPPNLQVLASGLRAGFTFLGAMVAMVEHAAEPSKSELSRAITDEQLGVPFEEGIRRVADRMANRDLEQVAMLSELLRTTGGNAAEVLDTVVLTVRERHDIRRLVRTLTTQGRMARWILTILPIATGLAFWAIQPDIVGSMWTSAGGQIALLIAAIMVAAGSYSIQKIIEIEV